MSIGIRDIKGLTDLVSYFSQNLGWDIDTDGVEDIEDFTYGFSAIELGLKEESFARITALRQLPRMVKGQRWGIFCVEFDSKRFEPSALKKILSGLVPLRRNSANHAVWNHKDLLFLCHWGHENSSTIGLAHFEEKEGSLPQIKMFSCTPAMEDITQIKVFEDKLDNLRWPKNPDNTDEWHNDWSSAFTTIYKQNIKDSSELTKRLAAEARNIRKRILEIMSVETDKGYVHQLFTKFKDDLIHDMTKEKFAGLYAETIVYGLFSARCMDKKQETFSAEEAITWIPNTNPFLKSLMQKCMSVENSSKLSFDELEIGNVVDLLRATRTDEIIKDFNRQTGGGKEDPVIHFYEEFLTEYDNSQKKERGVYYTPQPVVNFIVGAVDTIIKDEFKLKDGLASTKTKTIKITRKSKKKNKDGDYPIVEDTDQIPAIQLLDPATGTGTFIRQAILQVYDNFKQAHTELSDIELKAAWNQYVPKHLLPRVNAFELIMAPYAVAHMKLAMVLKDTGYEFKSNKRLNVYLTNSLEEPGNSDMQRDMWDDSLASESVSANAAKINNGINVVIGNPPYKGASANKGAWIQFLMEDYKKEPGGLVSISEKEKNPKWINDDYVKFIRYAQTFIDKSDNGIIAFINPHGFLDYPTYRGMRWFLLKSFSKIYILDLHGNATKKEKCPDGSKDENVFNIKQGVCIFIAIKRKNKSDCKVYHADLYGTRSHKYSVLNSANFTELEWTQINPIEDMYLFVKQNTVLQTRWNSYFNIKDAFPVNGVAIRSCKDNVAFQNSKEQILDVLHDFKDMSENDLRAKYNITDESEDYKVEFVKENVTTYGIDDKYLCQCLYRPFDVKWTYYTNKNRGFLGRPAYKVLRHMSHDNLGLILGRQGKAANLESWNVVFASNKIVDLNIFRRGGGCIFPLYLYEEYKGQLTREVNISDQIITVASKNLGLQFKETRPFDSYDCFTPEDLWAYIYAILHSPTYRTKYKEFLNLDFPRIPYPNNKKVFWKLVSYGNCLKSLHLMESDGRNYTQTTLSSGSNLIEKVIYKDHAVYINKDRQCFSPITEEAYLFQIGGYQPIEKWLKDRQGSVLSSADVSQYISLIGVITHTIQIMQYIDKEIEVIL